MAGGVAEASLSSADPTALLADEELEPETEGRDGSGTQGPDSACDSPPQAPVSLSPLSMSAVVAPPRSPLGESASSARGASHSATALRPSHLSVPAAARLLAEAGGSTGTSSSSLGHYTDGEHPSSDSDFEGIFGPSGTEPPLSLS
jgi:hypothetical protein